METSVALPVGIELPTMQPPIGWLFVPALAGAVSDAGGLGMMGQRAAADRRVRPGARMDVVA